MSQTHPIKKWNHEMQADDIKAVEAVADSMGVDLPGGPSFDPGRNGWLEKARSITYLIDGTREDVESALTDSMAGFTSDEFYPLGLALVKIGDYHLSRGHLETAYPYYKTACSIIPDNPVLWFKFGEMCFDMKLLTQSRNSLLKAHSLMPDVNYFNLLRAKSSYLLGRIERLGGKNSDATVWFERSLKSFPEFKLSKEMLKTQSRLIQLAVTADS
jgi:tetratricopeptide (TPR) repeat protein